MKIKFLLSFLVFSVFTSAAFSQVERQGFLIGFGLGISDLYDKNLFGEDRSDNLGVGGNFFMGGSFTEEFALMGMYDFHVGVEEVMGDKVSVVNSFLGPVAQFNFLNRLWFRAGPGITSLRAEKEIDVGGGAVLRVGDDRSGFGAFLGGGVEVWQTGRFALDLNIRAIPQWYKSEDGGFALISGAGLGFTWY